MMKTTKMNSPESEVRPHILSDPLRVCITLSVQIIWFWPRSWHLFDFYFKLFPTQNIVIDATIPSTIIWQIWHLSTEKDILSRLTFLYFHFYHTKILKNSNPIMAALIKGVKFANQVSNRTPMLLYTATRKASRKLITHTKRTSI